ncbi:hypothetical protein SAMN05216490_4178 [Mucilaginibacter mallensis]|uniref:Glycoamylase-like domain-containing protein n=2 Tax=Mucilaginibacter mallensis TaxID=652787 RepID=A0A1H2BKA6_MUCMA|nr:hypothetical protein SAMN05216490_4178 [Mucilaginibacter mallensis]
MGFAGMYSCSKSSDGANTTPTHPVPPTSSFTFSSAKVNGVSNGLTYINVNATPVIKLSFAAAISTASVNSSIAFTSSTGTTVAYTAIYQNGDSTVVITPSKLSYLTKYTIAVSTALKSSKGGSLESAYNINLTTSIDSINKFPTITDDALLTLVQQQTFKYFWDFGHPTSGLARERNTSADVITTGGSGFGIMAIVVGVNRGFISRAQGLTRMQTIVGFLKNNAQTFHGAFPHWLNGVTGGVVPFSTQDDGADLVETSYLMEGLLTARQYFNGSGTDETNLRTDINTLWNNVEWDWFRQNGQNTLYWHWSPDYAWSSNQTISGWNEALITYVLAASSTTHSVPKIVYTNGWANNGAMKNGSSYFGVTLPLGPVEGGPLFFTHYSFLGINPNGLTDAYASYDVQNKAHAMINYDYCVANPNNNQGYSADCWGLTASDIENGGYNASSPTSDVGVIAPTAAIASLPYTPTQSMAALRFFYYKLGDKMWGPYGFYDSFDLNDAWFATSNLAIDEGPIIDNIENYRSGLLWNLFMSCPEVKTGMKSLGFTSPNL